MLLINYQTTMQSNIFSMSICSLSTRQSMLCAVKNGPVTADCKQRKSLQCRRLACHGVTSVINLLVRQKKKLFNLESCFDVTKRRKKNKKQEKKNKNKMKLKCQDILQLAQIGGIYFTFPCHLNPFVASLSSYYYYFYYYYFFYKNVCVINMTAVDYLTLTMFMMILTLIICYCNFVPTNFTSMYLSRLRI